MLIFAFICAERLLGERRLVLDPIHTNDSALCETECSVSKVRSISRTSCRSVSFHSLFVNIAIHDCDLKNIFLTVFDFSFNLWCMMIFEILMCPS